MEKEKGMWLQLLLYVAAVAAMLQLCHHCAQEYVTIDGSTVSKDVEALDLRGESLDVLPALERLQQLKSLDLRDTGLTEQQYLRLHERLPVCEILWSVPFRDGFVSSDVAELAAAQLSEEDIRMIGYLGNLKTLDLRGCRDYGLIRTMKQSHPELEIPFDVELGGKVYSDAVEELELRNAEADVLEQVLPLLQALKQVTFTGKNPENARILQWKTEYPQVVFVWQFQVCGVTASSRDEKLILNDIPMESVAEVEAALDNFYNLQWVEMCNCGIPSPEMDALWERHPETRFVWVVQVGRCTLRTDVVNFMPYQFGYNGNRKIWDSQTAELKYCVDIECMDMGHMGITDYSFLEYMPKMKYLILADTDGTDFSALAGLKELIYLELFMTRFDQAEVLTGLTKLEDLNIGHSGLNNIEPLLEMTWLKRLWLPGNVKLSPDERKQVVEALPNTWVVYACEGSTGGGWREGRNYYDMRDRLNMPYFPGGW